MRRLLPEVRDEGLDELYLDLDVPAGRDRPYVYLGMVASVDGAATLAGRSGGLGGAADRIAFRRLRETCDVILVGAGTVRTEGYGPPRLHDGTAERRLARGLNPRPTLAVVTASADLDPASRLFADADLRPTIVTVDGADATALEPVADVVRCGIDQVDLSAALDLLWDRGARRVLCEGGPSLNTGLLQSGLVDELFLTVAPTLVGSAQVRIVADGIGDPWALELLELRHHDNELLLRYRLDRTSR